MSKTSLRRSAARLALAAAAAAAVTVTVAPAGASADPLVTQPGELVVNGGGEDGTTGWTGRNFLPIPYTAGGYPANTLVGPTGALGTFNGGTYALHADTRASEDASQLVDLTPSAASIDTGKVTAKMSAHVGGFGTQNDRGGVTYQFLGTDGNILATQVLPAPMARERGNVSGSVFREATVAVPVGTRSVNVVAQFIVDFGSNEAVVDNVSLTLDAAPSQLQVTHTSDAAGPIQDGQVVNYTVTLTNSGGQPVTVDRALALAGVLDDADLVSGPTSSDGALVVSGAGDLFGINGTLAPGQTVTVVYSVVAKPYAEQGDHNLVSVLADPANLPAGVPGSCAGAGDCLEVATADTAAVPLVNPAVAGVAAAVVLAGGGAFMFTRRRKATTA
ncbi:hypothetical protein [Rhodococcus sp. ACT016]|uniref:DUF7927 domain-containing protein n=1 Tax=Rhodococcus sp. ACT016 TaxID=3134808 RepID=UPI003D2A175D